MTAPTAPIDYRSRKHLWIHASLWLSCSERPTVAFSIQNLGFAERVLLELEADLARLASDPSMKRNRDRVLGLGLYEALRTIREAAAPVLSFFAHCFGNSSCYECRSQNMN